MATFWDRVKGLNGTTLQTATLARRFTVTDVKPDKVCFVPDDGSRATKSWPRRQMEDLNEIYWEEPEITPQMVRAHYPKDQNAAYAATIMNAVKEE